MNRDSNWKRRVKRARIGGFTLAVQLGLSAAASASAPAEPTPILSSAPIPPRQAPPTPAPQERQNIEPNDSISPPSGQRTLSNTLPRYSIGEPIDEEQLYLEFINRSRADPNGEAQRFKNTTDPAVLADYEFFAVDLDLMISQFAALPVAPPLSLNPNLTAAARLHSRDMLDNQYQGHTGTDGSTTGSRATAQGYDWTSIGENAFATAFSVWHGHAGFDVDWGGSPGATLGGMQNPPGHRKIIHEPSFREIGIGVVNGTNGKFGPQVVTQDFGNRRNPTPFLTGVAYYDFNGNQFYDIGEGIGGVAVQVAGAPYSAVTSTSGGYSVPVPASGTFVMTFSLSGQPDLRRTVTVANNQNLKVDFTPEYSPPVISGDGQAVVNQNNRFQFTSVGGAAGYQWKQNRRIPATESEGAENGLSGLTVQTSPGYSVIDSVVKASGRNAFHLAHPLREDQILTLNRLYLVRATSQLMFASRLGFAGNAQTARAEISTDHGQSWIDVWNQTGTLDAEESAFSLRSISLAEFADNEIMVRFRYAFGSGSYFNQTTPGVGFYIDDITVTDADELFDERISDVAAGTSFLFQPTATGDYALRVRAQLPGRMLPWGPVKLVTVQTGGIASPILRLAALRVLSPDRVSIDIELEAGTATTLVIESADGVAGPWLPDDSATFEVIAPGTRFRANAAAGADASRFYRIRTR